MPGSAGRHRSPCRSTASRSPSRDVTSAARRFASIGTSLTLDNRCFAHRAAHGAARHATLRELGRCRPLAAEHHLRRSRCAASSAACRRRHGWPRTCSSTATIGELRAGELDRAPSRSWLHGGVMRDHRDLLRGAPSPERERAAAWVDHRVAQCHWRSADDPATTPPSTTTVARASHSGRVLQHDAQVHRRVTGEVHEPRRATTATSPGVERVRPAAAPSGASTCTPSARPTRIAVATSSLGMLVGVGGRHDDDRFGARRRRSARRSSSSLAPNGLRPPGPTCRSRRATVRGRGRSAQRARRRRRADVRRRRRACATYASSTDRARRGAAASTSAHRVGLGAHAATPGRCPSTRPAPAC